MVAAPLVEGCHCCCSVRPQLDSLSGVSEGLDGEDRSEHYETRGSSSLLQDIWFGGNDCSSSPLSLPDLRCFGMGLGGSPSGSGGDRHRQTDVYLGDDGGFLEQEASQISHHTPRDQGCDLHHPDLHSPRRESQAGSRCPQQLGQQPEQTHQLRASQVQRMGGGAEHQSDSSPHCWSEEPSGRTLSSTSRQKRLVSQPSSVVSGDGNAEEETFSRLLCDKAAQALQEIREPRASAPRLSLRRTISELGALARQSSLRQSPLATPISSSDQDAQDAQRGPGPHTSNSPLAEGAVVESLQETQYSTSSHPSSDTRPLHGRQQQGLPTTKMVIGALDSDVEDNTIRLAPQAARDLVEALKKDYETSGRDVALLQTPVSTAHQKTWARKVTTFKKLPAGELTIANTLAWIQDSLISESEQRMRLSVLVLFPSLAQLSEAPELKKLHKKWNESVPRHISFYDVLTLPQNETQPLDWRSEIQVRDYQGLGDSTSGKIDRSE